MTPWEPSPDPATAVDQVRRWLDSPTPEPVVIATSGSGGEPKQVLISRDACLAAATASAEVLGASRWALGIPPQRIGGFQVIVRSLLAGADPVVLDRTVPLLDQLPDEPVSVAIVSTQLVRWADSDIPWSRFATVLVGGGPVSSEGRRRAEAGGAHVVASYGMTETAGGVVYDGAPLPTAVVRLTAEGRIAVAGPMLADGYRDAALTAQHFRDGWFLTDDLGHLDADGRLRVVGRRDDMILSGGEKIPAAAVADRVAQLPSAGDVAVVGAADAEWGEVVVAVVTGPVPLAELRDWVAEAMPRTWAPRRVVRVDTLPLLSSGKPDRHQLKALAAEASS